MTKAAYSGRDYFDVHFFQEKIPYFKAMTGEYSFLGNKNTFQQRQSKTN